MNFSSNSEREHLKLQYRRERDRRIRDRIKAVLLYDEGCTPKEIAKTFSSKQSHYRNKAVKQHLTCSKVCLHFLPPYSPNLNPVERFWKWMKERVIYNTNYEPFKGGDSWVFLSAINCKCGLCFG